MAHDFQIEREREIATLARSVRECAAGAGGMLVVEGAAGVGKTSLVGVARELTGADARFLAARGSELESSFAFGVVRQLLGGWLESASADERRRVLDGAAGRAGAVVDAVVDPAAMPVVPDDRRSMLEALYRMCSSLAAGRPLVLAVDDAHWADEGSLAFCEFLARRVERRPILLILAGRSGDPGLVSSSWLRLRADPGAVLVSLAPLTARGTAALVARRLGVAADPAFVTACHAATGGNPFLLGELLRTLGADGVEPVAGAAGVVERVVPRTVSVAVLLRLRALGTDALSLARAVAVLGPGSEPALAATLAELPLEHSWQAVDRLVGAEILAPEPSLSFTHPMVREAVYRDIGLGERTGWHARAARSLVERGAAPERVAAQLLRCEPGGEAARVEWLREAARVAAGRAAARAAVVYLRRALEEPPRPDVRAGVLFEVGCAELAAVDPAAVGHLELALRETGTALERAPVRAALARALVVLAASPGDADGCLRTGIDDLGDGDHGPRARLECQRAQLALLDPDLATALDHGRVAGLAMLGERAGSEGRGLLLCVAHWLALRTGRQGGRVLELLERGWAGGALVLEEGADAPGIGQALAALVFVGELDRARVLSRLTLDRAVAAGSANGRLIAGLFGALAALRAGDLHAAEAEARVACEVARDHELVTGSCFTLPVLALVLVERDRAGEAAEVLAGAPAHARGVCEVTGLGRLGWPRVLLAQGRTREALEELEACGPAAERFGIRNPAVCPWRSTLALALPADQHARATALVEAELRLGRAAGVARGVGVAQMAAGVLAERAAPGSGVGLLRDAVGTLAGSPERLEHARALCELGGALRRGGHRRDARPQLERALDAAHRSGAVALADRVRGELRAVGAKPRRDRLTGPDALTPSERRVCELAMTGLTNIQMARALSVTVHTVAAHLSHAYAKLAITSRAQLPGVLGPPGRPDAASADDEKLASPRG